MEGNTKNKELLLVGKRGSVADNSHPKNKKNQHQQCQQQHHQQQQQQSKYY